MIQIVKADGTTYGGGSIQIIDKYGKPKTPFVPIVWGTITGTLSAQTDLQNALNLKEDKINKGLPNGYASLNGAGLVPSSQLPSYVDDIVEVANYAALPIPGETGKIYVTLDTNEVYRWSGSVYIEIAANPAVWGTITGTVTAQTDLTSYISSNYYPLVTNPAGYITSAALAPYLTSATAASTYYPLTNPNGYISGITSGMVTTALGFTPYDAANPAGYITSSALTPYLLSSTAASTYYPLTNPSGYITASALTPYLTTASAALTYYPIPTGTTSQYIRGDGSVASFPTIPSVTPSALTKTDDTNVTLTLGGSPSTALLAATSITVGWTGTLADSRIASASTWNAKQNALSGTGFVKSTAGVISYDTNTYLTTADAASTYYPLTNPAGYITASSLTGYVPYTGATADLNLGTYNLKVGNGTVSNNSIQIGAANVGLFSPSANRIDFVTNGVARMAIISNGNVVMGNTTTSVIGNSYLDYVTNQTGLKLSATALNLAVTGSNLLNIFGVTTTGNTTSFSLTKPNNTGQTATFSISGWTYNGGSRQWNTGNIGTQNENVWGSVTYDFVGASIVSKAIGNVFNAPIAGTNATITNNFAAQFNGRIELLSSISFNNGTDSMRISRASGALGRLAFSRPGNEAVDSVTFGGGNEEIYIRSGAGRITHSGPEFQIQNTTGSTGLGLYSNAGDLNLYGNSSTNALRVFGGTRNVLIQNGGTYTDAGYRLDVNGTGRFQNGLVLQTPSTTTPLNIQGPDGAGTFADIRLGTGTAVFTTIRMTRPLGNYASNLSFYTSAAGSVTQIEALRIFDTQNIAIGSTTEPGYKFHVTGKSYFTDNVAINYPSLSAIYKLGVGGNMVVNGSLIIQDDSGNLSAYSSDGLTPSGGASFNRYVGVNIYSSNTNPIKFAVNGAEAIRIFNGGNVSIGSTTDGGFKLDVNGTGRFQTSITTPLINGVSGNLAFANAVQTSGAITAFTFTKPNNTGQTASTSIAGWNYNGGSRTWLAGAIGTQSENVWGSVTYNFAGASVVDTAYGNVFNQATAGTNATISNNYAGHFTGNIFLSGGNRTIRGSNGLILEGAAGGPTSVRAGTSGSVNLGITGETTGLTYYGYASTGASTSFNFTRPNNIGQTASTAIPGWNYLGNARTWLVGNITAQNENVWGAVTYNFGAASVIAKAIGNVFNAPIAGTNTTITSNWAAQFNGNVEMVGAMTSLYYMSVSNPNAVATASAKFQVTNAAGNTSQFSIASNSDAVDPSLLSIGGSNKGVEFSSNSVRALKILDGSRNVTIQNGGTVVDNGYRLEVFGTTNVVGTTSTDSVTLSAEQLTTGTGANWTGTGYATGYTHTVGSVVPLVSAFIPVSNTYYQIVFTLSGRTAGSVNIAFSLYSLNGLNTNGTTTIGIRSLSTVTPAFTLTPTTDFDGTIVASIKFISAVMAPLATYKTSTSVVNTEIRSGVTTQNTYIGANVGRYNTTGLQNVGLGFNAMPNNMTGGSNTVIGYVAGVSNVNGSNNTYVGTAAGYFSVSGASNTCIGASAGYNVTGGSNVYIGVSTGNGSSGPNIGIGGLTLAGLTTGASNNGVGYASLQLLTTASYNDALGREAGANNTTGSNNQFFGFRAGRYIADGTTSNAITENSIFIGSQTKALANNQINQIVIGHSTTGIGSNTTVLGNSSTVTTAIYGNLMLGTTTASTYKLDVQGTANILTSLNLGNYATPTAQRIFTIGQDTSYTTIGSLVGATSNAAMYMNTATPTVNNYVFRSDGANVWLNSPSAGASIILTTGSAATPLRMYGNLNTASVASYVLVKPTYLNGTASTAIPGWSYDGTTRQWLTGNITTQNENVWGATTYSFVGASTIATAFGNVFNAPIAGTNCTITTNYAARFNGAIYSDSTNSSIFDNSAGSNYLRVRRTGGTVEAVLGATSGGVFVGSSTVHSTNIQSAGVTRLSFSGIGNGDCTLFDAMFFIFGSTTGNKLGTAITQKLSFWNATPIVQPANTVSLNGVLETTGLMASGSTVSTINKPLVAGANTTPRTGVATDGVTSVLGDLQNFTTEYHSGEVLYNEVSGEALNFGQLCWRDRFGKWQLALGNVAGEPAYNMLGICLHTVGAADTAISILTRGYVETTYIAAGRSGDPLFMDATTAGSIVNAQPSAAGNVVRIIGNLFWANSVQTNGKWIVYFNPDNTWIEL